MFFERSNVQAKLAGSQAEASAIVFGCGAAPCHTLVVNAARHPSIDTFLRAARSMRDTFEAAAGTDLVDSGRLRVARATIGSGVDLARLGWPGLDAVLMADSFDHLADVLHELASSSS